MTDYMRKHMGHECPPRPDHPAEQPKPPGDGSGCDDYPPTTPPTLDPPKPCPPPDSCCDCGDTPPSDSNCLQDLITQMQAETKALQQETEFTAELNKLLDAAKKASQDYSRNKYDELIKTWIQEDIDLAELVRKLVCAVPCWRCVIDCFICPWLNKLRDARKWLYDDGKLITTVNDLYDLRYWLTRDREYKNQRLERIKAVLKAWETPSTTIEQTLAANRAKMEEIGPFIGPHPGKAIYDVFLVLIPRHLAIAPPVDPKSDDHTTRIDKKYTEFCPCDEGTPDDCCGPDVGYLTFRERLVGPLPYLINPNQYFDLICCLVKKRYTPAKDAVSKADSELTKINGQIEGYEKALGDTWKADFEKVVRAAIPDDIDCCDYEKHGDEKPRQSY